MYEDEAAARARGEDVPLKPPADAPNHSVIPPASLLTGEVVHASPKEEKSKLSDAHLMVEADTSETLAKQVDDSMEMDEFHGFHDLDENQFLSHEEEHHEEGNWDDLQKLMGMPPHSDSDNDVSVAPKLEEAEKQNTEAASAPIEETKENIMESTRENMGENTEKTEKELMKPKAKCHEYNQTRARSKPRVVRFRNRSI